jgi:hypothetical protein
MSSCFIINNNIPGSNAIRSVLLCGVCFCTGLRLDSLPWIRSQGYEKGSFCFSRIASLDWTWIILLLNGLTSMYEAWINCILHEGVTTCSPWRWPLSPQIIGWVVRPITSYVSLAIPKLGNLKRRNRHFHAFPSYISPWISSFSINAM